NVDRALREARTCYRHLAGRLGVALSGGMRRLGYVDAQWNLTGSGREWLTSLGIELPSSTRRPLLRPCLDWTERRDHLAGVAAEQMLVAFQDRHWIDRSTTSRAVHLTAAAHDALSAVPADADAAEGSPVDVTYQSVIQAAERCSPQAYANSAFTADPSCLRNTHP